MVAGRQPGRNPFASADPLTDAFFCRVDIRQINHDRSGVDIIGHRETLRDMHPHALDRQEALQVLLAVNRRHDLAGAESVDLRLGNVEGDVIPPAIITENLPCGKHSFGARRAKRQNRIDLWILSKIIGHGSGTCLGVPAWNTQAIHGKPGRFERIGKSAIPVGMADVIVEIMVHAHSRGGCAFPDDMFTGELARIGIITADIEHVRNPLVSRTRILGIDGDQGNITFHDLSQDPVDRSDIGNRRDNPVGPCVQSAIDQSSLDFRREPPRAQVFDIDVVARGGIEKPAAKDLPEDITQNVMGDSIKFQALRSH
ncbi:hypothetical protein AGR4C_pa50004 [Agrobacterium tumefaciens str. Kerr 14]|uniref:Uncharacterized protein n=1 Tax=Agrobacterium tumefaciens str. Kerr 14 TaxID=1183424 RepID=A0A1S7SAQ4_AGRTU|nr:hypothetical protein AGR4C_pa50004 [Agrobacterium tumefaciens str. Kerr 14]